MTSFYICFIPSTLYGSLNGLIVVNPLKFNFKAVKLFWQKNQLPRDMAKNWLPCNKILCLSAFGHRKQTGRLYPTHFKSLSSHVYNSNFVVDIVVVVRSEICLK